MTEPSDREIEPLSPPPGSFDRVVKTAHARRRRRGAIVTSSVAALALVAGASFALGNSTGVTQQIIDSAVSVVDRGPSPEDTPVTTNQASPTRSKESKTAKPVSSSAVAGGGGASVAGPTSVEAMTPRPMSFLRGHVRDPEGRPLANILVQPGVADHATFITSGQVAAETNTLGNFKIPCPRAPVLLSTWPLGRSVTSPVIGGAWAATFVGGSPTQAVVPACGNHVATVTMEKGSTLTGTVQVTGSCPDATFPLWVWLDGDRNSTVRIDGLRDGDTYRYSGLPSGTHVLGARGITTPLVVAAGGTVEQDAAFTCPVIPTQEPTGSSGPTTEPETPSPTVTETPTASESSSGPTSEPSSPPTP